MECPSCHSRHGGCRLCNPDHPEYANSELSQVRKINKELLEALEMALEWIDSVPRETPLPAVPGFDRDWVNDVIAKATAKGK